MVVRVSPADVGSAWLCETVVSIDAEALTSGYPRLRRERGYQSLRSFQGLRGWHARPYLYPGWRLASMQVLYERCAAVDAART